MHEHPNSLLKVGCLLFIVGGLASALVTLAGLLLSVGRIPNCIPMSIKWPGHRATA